MQAVFPFLPELKQIRDKAVTAPVIRSSGLGVVVGNCQFLIPVNEILPVRYFSALA